MTKPEIIELVSSDNLDLAFKAVQKAKNNSNDIILLKSRWNGLKKEMANGTISSENANLNKNRIVNSFLAIVSDLPDDLVVEGIEMPSGSSQGHAAPNPSKQARVFISYNHKDKETANRISDFLKANNVSVTIDSESMKASEDIKSFINKSIRDTEITLALVSTSSLMSAWVGMESVNTLVGEQIAYKQFIPVAIETSFFERTFVDDALDKIDADLAEISGIIQKRIAKGRRFEDLQTELSRYKDLSSKLPTIVANLKDRLTIDISGDQFDSGMQRVLDTINS